MAENTEEFSPNAEPRSIIDKIEEKIQQHDSSSSSDSDDDKSEPSSSAAKTSIRRLFWREKPVHQVLGGGKPADIFLWRNKKISAGVFSVSTVIWILFELLEYHLLTVVSYGLISTLAILFLWSKAAMLINKFPPIIPELSIPEDLALNVTFSLRYQINKSFAVLRDIVSGRDLKKFLLVIFGLWVLSTIGSSCSLLTLIYIAFVLLHTVPAVYEKYEEKVDLYWEKAMEELEKHYTVIHASILTKIPKTPQLWAALACF